ncbi:Ig-like domain-containing protein [Mycolicibacterium diernhoferi]|uniref:Ig-like domain-containing protein n=1 Tax=Mycolicibacterium diernhoferi TaxID=1801 RepID=UPI0013F61873|nr:Ig-like domain-containing protein [Mycolicibacterium diernhoferi]QYL20729.1 VCBS domain-containing protein [Mycolicibacterium diernhoferi]
MSASTGVAKGEVVAALAAPSVAPGTDVPVQSPAEWVLLAAARRQVGDTDAGAGAPAARDFTGQALAATALGSVGAGAAPGADAGTTDPTLIATITVGSMPRGVVVSPDGKRVYVANYDGTVSVINAITNTTVGEPIPVGSYPTNVVVGSHPIGLAVSPDGKRVYVANSAGGTVAVINTATNAVIAGARTDIASQQHDVAVSPDGKRVYVTSRNYSTLSVMDTATNKIIGSGTYVESWPEDVAVSPDGKRVYLNTQGGGGTVTVIDTGTNKVIGSPITIGGIPSGLAVSPDGTRVYATNYYSVSVIDTVTHRNTVIYSAPLVGASAAYLVDVAVSPDNTRVYFTSVNRTTGAGTVSVIDTATNAMIGVPITVGSKPQSLAVSPDGTRIYVTGMNATGINATGPGTVSVIAVPSPGNRAPTGGSVTGINANSTSGVVTGTITGVTDADKDTLKYTAMATKGTVKITSKGTFTYTPTAAARHSAAMDGASAAEKSDTVTVTVSDGHGGVLTKTVDVPIAPKNTAPAVTVKVGKPSAATGVVTGTVKASDADKDALTFSAPASTSKGAVTLNAATGAFIYTPTAMARHAAAATGAGTGAKTDTFTMTVTDGHGGVATKTVTVSIAPTNSTPTVTSTPSVGVPDTGTGTVTGNLGAHDLDGDALSFKATPKKGSIQFAADGTFAYTPTAAARHAAAVPGAKASVTSETFTVTVTDAYGGKVSKAVTVGIAPANVLPVALTGSAGTPSAKTGAVTGKVTAADADKDKLTYSAANTAKGKVSINAKTGAFTYTPTAAARHTAASVTATDADTKDIVTVTVSDGHGGTATHMVTVSVAPKNTAPNLTATVSKPNASTGIVTAVVKAADTDKDYISLIGMPTAAKGSLTLDTATGVFTYTPTAAARHAAAKVGATSADKQDSFAVTVTDGHGGTTTRLVTVAIAPANTTPALAATPTVNNPNLNTGTVTGTLAATDADGDALTFKATPKKGTITFGPGGEFTYTPTAAVRAAAAKTNAPASAKQETFTVTVTDGFGGTATKTVTVAIAPAGTAPTRGGATVGTPNAATGVVTGTLGFTDPAGEPLTYTVTSNPTRGSVTVSPAGTFTYTPTAAARLTSRPAYSVSDVFTVVATNATGSTPETVTVPVSPGKITVTTIPVGAHPSGVVASPDGKLLYVSFPYSHAVSVINTDSTSAAYNTVVATYTVDNSGALAITPDGSRLYIASNKAPKWNVSVVDTTTGTVAAVPVANSINGNGSIAISPDGNRGYFTNGDDGGSISVIDTNPTSAAYNTVVATIPMTYASAGVAFSPNGSRAYVTSWSSNYMSVINTATNTVTSSFAVRDVTYLGNVVVSADGKTAYIATNWVTAIDTATHTTTATIISSASYGAKALAFSPDGSLLYEIDLTENLNVINTATKTLLVKAPVVNAANVIPNFVGLAASSNGNVYILVDGNFGAVQVVSIGSAT